MEIENLIKKMKDINSALIDFIEATDNQEAEFKTLIEFFDKQKILENEDEIQLLFQLISKISDNHHRTPDFFDKLEKIFRYLIKDNPSPISYFIPDYTKCNKRILYLLLEKRFVKPDETFLKKYLQNRNQNSISKPNNTIFCPSPNHLYSTNNTEKKSKFSHQYSAPPHNKKEPDMTQTFYYLYPKMKEFLEEKIQKQVEKEISQKYSETILTFEEKCQIGENDSHICSLIRSDSVEEFIAYVNRTNFSLLTKIKPSIYETNSFLIDKEPTLIEYAAFYGSTQIIQYLKYSKVPLTHSLWLYAIHSNNAELIHFLEENEKILFDDEDENIEDEENNDDDEDEPFTIIEGTEVKPEKNKNKISFDDEEVSEDNEDEPFTIIEENEVKPNKNKELFDNVLKESIKCHHNAITNYIKDNFYEQIQSDNENLFYKKLSDIIVDSLNFVFVPKEIESMICESIKRNGFTLSQLCFSFTKITIPSSVTSIGNSAFKGCSSLTQITIPSSVTSIENNAFRECSSLTQIIIPSSVTKIGNNAFLRCSSLTQITIPSSVISIGDSAFYYCDSLAKMTIPSSVTLIGNNAFTRYSLLTQITIPSSVTSIGNNAFSGCSSLTQITIPSSVIKIGNNAFNGCLLLSDETMETIDKIILNANSSKNKITA